jgi:hypothetical protein
VKFIISQRMFSRKQLGKNEQFMLNFIPVWLIVE